MTDQAAYERAIAGILASLDRLTVDELRAATAALRDARGQLLARIVGLPPDSYNASVLSMLLGEVNRLGVEYDARLRRHVTDALRASWNIGVDGLPAALSAAGVDVRFAVGLDSALLNIATQMTADLVTRVSQGFVADVSREIRLSIMGGLSQTETARRVTALLATETARHSMGSLAAQAERIIRTETMRVFSLANEARQRQAAELLPGLLKYWLSAEDERTRPDHIAADARYRPGGSVGPIPVSADFIVGGERAKHPHDPRLSAKQSVNCRCRSVSWLPEWAEQGRDAA